MVGKVAFSLQWKRVNRPFTADPIQLPFAQHDLQRRQRIAIGGRNEPTSCPDRKGTIEERKRREAPFAQGTSLEKNVGDRVGEPSVGYTLLVFVLQ